MATTAENQDGANPENDPTIERLFVRSEDEAFELLQRALANELAEQPYVLVFDNWPLLTLRFVGDEYHSTITPQIAGALVELQHVMNRTYARHVRHATNANVLTKEERSSIEFKAKVDEGSSLITVDLGNFAEVLSTALVTTMTGPQLVVLVLGLAVTGASYIAFKAWLAAQSEDKKIDQATKQTVQLSEQETQRMQIFANAMAANPALKASHDDFDNMRHDILKSVGDATSLDVQGIALSQEQARKIATTPRVRAEEVQLNGTYRIVKLDWSKEDEVRISVFGVGAERREFIASMRAHNLTNENIEKLKACEWERRPVHLTINATVLRGDVTTATIVGVEWPTETVGTEAGTAS